MSARRIARAIWELGATLLFVTAIALREERARRRRSRNQEPRRARRSRR